MLGASLLVAGCSSAAGGAGAPDATPGTTLDTGGGHEVPDASAHDGGVRAREASASDTGHALVDATTDEAAIADGATRDGSDAGGIACGAQGTFCGGHGVSGGDPGTLYVCGAQGAAPASTSVCSHGCQQNPVSPDECAVIDAGGGSLACAGPGYYCGGDMLAGGDPKTLYDCPGTGLAPSSSQVCATTCQVEPAGTNDLCAGTIVCPSLTGDYCGGDSLGGDPSTLYHCSAAGQAPSSSQVCGNGCATKPSGTNDVCRSAQSCPGTGAYCGSDGVQGGDAKTLYQCPGAGQAPTSSQPCASGCTIEPAGTPDFCAATSTCPTTGDYCGNDRLGGPANILFHCTTAGQAPSSSTVCSGGCLVEPQGSSDVCAGGGACDATEQSALNWEANQLNSGNVWSDYCLGFVNTAYQRAGSPLGFLSAPTASDALAQAQATGRFVGWNGNCPCGAILFWAANSCNGEDGHVVICNGDGTVSTSGWPGFDGATHAGISWLDGEECGHTPSGYILP